MNVICRKFYWRDKANREIDFVVRRQNRRLDAIECKINPDHTKATAIKAFRKMYAAGHNFVIFPGITRPYRMTVAGHRFTVCDTGTVRGLLKPR